MYNLIETKINCPYCGETIDVLLDTQDSESEYIEDCQVCCRPIVFKLSEQLSGDIDVAVFTDNDVY
jgi:transcription elongation factor Elf1